MKKILSLVLFLNLYCVQGIAQNATLVECESEYFVYTQEDVRTTEDGYTFVYCRNNNFRKRSAKIICYNQNGIKRVKQL